MFNTKGYSRALNRKLQELIRNKRVQCSKPAVVGTRLFYSESPDEKIIKSVYKDTLIPKCTFGEYIWRDLDKWHDKTALVCGETGKSYTYSQLQKKSTTFAASLKKKFKLLDSDVIAIMLPNSPDFPVAALGAIQAGCIVTMINPVYTSHEVRLHLEVSKAKIVITIGELYGTVKNATKDIQTDIPILLTNYSDTNVKEDAINFSEFSEDYSIDIDILRSVNRTNEDIVILPFSSGTTGLPKGVELTHRNLIASNQQILDDQIVLVSPTSASNQDVLPAVIPFFHIFGFVVVMCNHLLQGCKLVTLPKFQPETFIKALAGYRSTAVFIVPPIVNFMGSHPAVKPEHLKSLKAVVCGAAPLAEIDAIRLVDKANNDLCIRQGYGLTETTSVGTVGIKKTKNYKSSGYPVSQCECKIVSKDGTSLGPGETGELLVKGPNVMRGYFNNAKANDEVFAPGGWFKTGDIASYDDKGSIYIKDRLKELIKVKGFQVAPAELEAILKTHPLVADVAVIGIPHSMSGEVPKAFIVPLPGKQPPSVDEIKQFVAAKVADFKKLSEVQFIDAIPKSAAGKILRKDIKKMYC